jgi:hypothetical protein
MDMRFELVAVPMSDVDRAEHFYKRLDSPLDGPRRRRRGRHRMRSDITPGGILPDYAPPTTPTPSALPRPND